MDNSAKRGRIQNKQVRISVIKHSSSQNLRISPPPPSPGVVQESHPLPPDPTPSTNCKKQWRNKDPSSEGEMAMVQVLILFYSVVLFMKFNP